MISAILTSLGPVLTCWLLLRGDRRAFGAERVVEICLAIACGGSAAAFSYLVCRVLMEPPNVYLAAVELAIYAIAIAAVKILRQYPGPVSSPTTRHRTPGWVHWLWVPCAGLGAVAFYSMMLHYEVAPYGDWDAIAMWNAKARFLALGGHDWKAVFSADIAHSEYPLLLPAGIARGWLYAGSLDTRIPFAIGLVTTVMTCVVLVAILTTVRGLSAGLLAGLTLLSTSPFLIAGASQFADVPFAFLMISAVAALIYRDQVGGDGLLLAAGWLAGAAAATKNEGVLFLGVLLLARFVQVVWAKGWVVAAREVGLLLLAALPGITVQVYGKVMSQEPNDLISGQAQASTLSRLVDPGRYAKILSAAYLEIMKYWRWVLIGLGAYAVFTAWQPRRVRFASLIQCWLIVGFMSAGYCLVYLTTPHDLDWHLKSSLSRLAVQLWPLFLLATFLTLNPPDATDRLGAEERDSVDLRPLASGS